MTQRAGRRAAPRGGDPGSTNGAPLKGWRRTRDGLLSVPIRCRREQWYLARVHPADAQNMEHAELRVRFLAGSTVLGQRCLTFHAVAGQAHPGELLGWIETPARATHVQLLLDSVEEGHRFQSLNFHPAAERDPKCHPLANVPRWTTCQPPFEIERVVLPAALAELQSLLPEQRVEVLRPGSLKQVARAARHAACILDPHWVRDAGLNWRDLERLAANGWLIVDLETTARLLHASAAGGVRTWNAAHGIMSARVEYADVPTRGFALQDVFPYGTITEYGSFMVRVLRADRAWKRQADQEGFATLLASETPESSQGADVLSAAKPVGHGELITTDLPWLVGDRSGTLLAPRLARHALRMHLAAPLADDVQYWNRWDDGQVVVRDIAELARRYAPLRTARWPAPHADRAQLGLLLPAPAGAARETVVIRTGRIDQLARHDGLPPEPMMIWIKFLARAAREQTAWAREHLAMRDIVWQFETAAGLKYASSFTPVTSPPHGTVRTLRLVNAATAPAAATPGEAFETWPCHEGVFGDGSLEWQAQWQARLAAFIGA